MIIDTHHHLWSYNEKDFPWISDDMTIIKKDFLDKAYQENFKDVDQTIVVQAVQNKKETDFLLDFANRNPKVSGVIGWLDIRSDHLDKELIHYKSNKKFKGLRHVLHDEVDQDYMLGTDFLNGLKKLEELDLIYELLIFPLHLDNTIQLVSMFPKLNFVLDHMAKPDIKAKDIEGWAVKIIELAKYPNVSIKLSGLVTEAKWHNWQKEDFYDYLDVALEAFGEDRIMYGSDWPVCLLSASYDDVLDIIKSWSQKLTTLQRNKIFAYNAINIYSL